MFAFRVRHIWREGDIEKVRDTENSSSRSPRSRDEAREALSPSLSPLLLSQVTEFVHERAEAVAKRKALQGRRASLQAQRVDARAMRRQLEAGRRHDARLRRQAVKRRISTITMHAKRRESTQLPCSLVMA